MKKLLLLFFTVLFTCFGFSQTKEIDSLKKELLKSSITDTTKIKLYHNLARQFAAFSKDSFGLYTNKALELSLKNKNFKLAKIYNYKGLDFINNAKPDSARLVFNKALKVLSEKQDNKTKANVLQNLALTFEGTSQFDKKIEYSIQSMELLKDDPYNQSVSLFNIGAIYSQSEIQDKALKYFKEALKVSETAKNINVQSASLVALGNIYLQEKKLDSAEVYLEQSLKICKQTNSSRSYYTTYKILGSLYSEQKQFDKSKEARLQTKKYAELIGDEKKIMVSIISLANYYAEVNDYKKSSELYNEFDNYYEKNPRMEIGVGAFRSWAEVEGRLGNVEKSNKLLDKYLSIKDSIYSKENRAIIVSADAKYQTEKKDKEIAQQQLTIEKSQAQTQTMTILIISLLLASILLWFSFRQRQKRIQQQLISIQKEQEVLTLESLIEGEEKERLRIAKELHDGVNGDLSAIKFKLSSLLKMNNTVINEAVTMIDNSCKQVRAISHNLVPPSLKDFSLIEAVSNYCENMNSIHKPEIGFQHIGDSIDLNKKVEVNIFRIIQELITNAIKHANATTIDSQISNRNNTILITVEDNGKGYDAISEEQFGIGLENIKSRAEYLNAKFEVVTNKNGTSNTIEIDLNKL